MKRILHIAESDKIGGASIAACRINSSFNNYIDNKIYESRLLVKDKLSDIETVFSPKDKLERRISNFKSRLLRKIFSTRYEQFSKGIHLTTAWPDSDLFNFFLEDYNYVPEILNIHWISYRTFSIEQISKLKQKVILTLHDQWAFSGAIHYDLQKGANNGYLNGYKNSYPDILNRFFNINRHTWLRKRKNWNSNFTIITPSRWMTNCARNSVLFKNSNIHTIPYPIDPLIWKSLNKEEARKDLNLDIDKFYLSFGSVDTNIYRKGPDLLLQCLMHLNEIIPINYAKKIELICFGKVNNYLKEQSPFKSKFYENIKNTALLNKIYAASNIFLLPSRVDNLPNTGLEAQSSGTPVIGFDCSGMKDVIEDEETGFLIKPFDTKLMAKKILLTLENDLYVNMSIKSRERSQKLWHPKVIAEMHKKILDNLI